MPSSCSCRSTGPISTGGSLRRRVAEYGTRVSGAMAAFPPGAAREGRCGGAPPRRDCRQRPADQDRLGRGHGRDRASARPGSAARRPGSSRPSRRWSSGSNGRSLTGDGAGGCPPAGHSVGARRWSPASASSASASSSPAVAAIGLAVGAGPRSGLPVGIAYAALLGLCLLAIRLSADLGVTALFFVFAIVWATDTGAFFAGRTIGGAKLWPRVSPKKTWAGAIGGLVAAVAAGLVVGAGRRPAEAAAPPRDRLFAVGRLPAGRPLRIGRQTPLRR